MTTAGRRFTVDVRREESPCIVVPSGELDLATVDLLEAPLRELADAGAREIVIDLRRLSFIDSTGLRLLLRWHNRASDDGIAYQLIQGRREIEHVFAVSGLLDRLPFVAADEAPPGESS